MKSYLFVPAFFANVLFLITTSAPVRRTFIHHVYIYIYTPRPTRSSSNELWKSSPRRDRFSRQQYALTLTFIATTSTSDKHNARIYITVDLYTRRLFNISTKQRVYTTFKNTTLQTVHHRHVNSSSSSSRASGQHAIVHGLMLYGRAKAEARAAATDASI